MAHSTTYDGGSLDSDALIVHDLPQDIVEGLDEERRLRGASLEETVVTLLRRALGWRGAGSDRSQELVGSWSIEDFEAFERVTETFREIELPEIWP
jgi:hypothetical protein